MPYIHEVVRAGITEEHRKYHTWYLHPPGEKRGKRASPSEERIRQSNQRQAERKLRGLMNENFSDGDYLLTLDFYTHKPRDSTEMQKLTAGFIRNLRYRLKKRGVTPKYLYVMEIGKRSSRHVHMIIERTELALITECWKYGGVHCTPLYSGGQYRQIASYFLKYALKTETTEKMVGKKWYGSRNLKKPKVIKRIILARTFREEAREKKGWNLDKASEYRGITAEGYPYYEYTYIKAETDEGKDIHTHENKKGKRGLHIRDRSPGKAGIGKQPDHKGGTDHGDKQKRGRGNLLAEGLAKIKRFFGR